MFKDKYTTQELKTKEPEKEKDKTELSTDTYAMLEGLEELKFVLRNR